MRYAEHTPAPQLAGRLRYWRLTGERTCAADFEPVLPDGCVEVIVHLGDPFRVQAEDGTSAVQPRALLAGPGTAPVRLQPTGRIDVIGARFVAGAAEWFDEPLSAFAERLPPLDEVSGPWARGLPEELAEPRAGESWTAVLDRHFLSAARQRGKRKARALALAVERLRATGGGSGVDALARELGLSTRQLERRFLADVGLGPKVFACLVRFQHALRLLSGARPGSLAAVAARAGYYDQAHLARDFTRFAGCSPGRFLRRDHELADHFAGSR